MHTEARVKGGNNVDLESSRTGLGVQNGVEEEAR